MTQVLIDRATLEHLVEALEKSVGAMQGLYGGWRCTQELKMANLAITAGRAALSNAEPKQPKTKSCATCKHSDSDGFPACLAQGATCYPQASGFGTNWEALNK